MACIPAPAAKAVLAQATARWPNRSVGTMKWPGGALTPPAVTNPCVRGVGMPKGTRGRSVCSIEGCERLVDSWGWCHTHAERARRTGHPLGSSRKPPSVRFWAKVKIGAPDECWPWGGGIHPKGYGYFYAGGAQFKTHRFAYEDKVGSLPPGFGALHRCDNPPCCNPAHLFAGTQADNIADCIAKGRAWWQNRVAS